MVFHFNNLESPSPKDALCQFGGIRTSGSGEVFKMLSMYFRFSQLSSLGKGQGSSFEQNLNSLHPRMHCAKFG